MKRTVAKREAAPVSALIAFPNAAFDGIGLLIEPSCSYDEWGRIGESLERISGAWQWWYGDWWNFGESRYGEKHAQALPDKEYDTKAKAAWVARQVQFSRRRQNLSFSHHAEVASLESREQDKWLDKAEANGWSVADLRGALKLRVHHSSESAEWNTPVHIVRAVVEVLGTIDLDPCSNAGTPNVPASLVFTEDDDGLEQPWPGRVYMNPPYGEGIGDWVAYLVSEYEANRTKEALALVPARPDTGWWRAINAYPWCGIYGRLHFGDADSGAPFPSAMFYLGTNDDVFVRVFGEFGAIYERR